MPRGAEKRKLCDRNDGGLKCDVVGMKKTTHGTKSGF